MKKKKNELWNYAVGSISTWRQLSSCFYVMRGRRQPFHLTFVASSLAQSLLETYFILFVNFFFPFLKINKTLNVFPSFSLLLLPFGGFILKCFPLVVGFSPPPFPLIIESINLQSSALLWFWKFKLFCFCESTGFCPLRFQLNFCVL